MTVLRKSTAFLLTVAILFTVFSPFVVLNVSADVDANIAKLSEWQKDFLHVIKSLAVKDAYDNHVFASITAGQALYEGGWARYGISSIANNQYGIKAYSTWDGKVFDNRTYMIYDSYQSLSDIKGSAYAKDCSLWRAYDSWDESVADHSALFLNSKRYAKVLTAETYQQAAREIVNAGYCSDNGYVETLINVIQSYGLDKLDTVEPDEYGVVGMIMDSSRRNLAIGATETLTATAYPEPQIIPADDSSDDESEEMNSSEESIGEESSGADSTETSYDYGEIDAGSSAESESSDVSEEPALPAVIWKSSNSDIAAVDQEGNVTGISQGFALITAERNGKEAACIVCVGTNAVIIDSDTTVYEKPDTSGKSLGKIYRGVPVLLLSDTVFEDPNGTALYKICGTARDGSLLTGYALAKRVYQPGREIQSMSTDTVLCLQLGDQYTPQVLILPETASNQKLTWRTSDKSIVSVSDEGVLTAVAEGTAVVTFHAIGGLYLQMIVNVGGTNGIGITTTDLKLRKNGSTDADYYGVIAGGTQVSVISGPKDGWYYIQAELSNNEIYLGYSLAQYIQVDREVPLEPGKPVIPKEMQRTGYVNVDTVLNVRKEAGTTTAKLVQVPNKTEVIILGDSVLVESEKTYRDWYHIGFEYNGASYDGYAATDFIVVTGVLEPDDSSEPYNSSEPDNSEDSYVPVENPIDPDESDETDPSLLEVGGYEKDETYIRNIDPGTTVETLLQQFNFPAVVIDADGEEKENHKLVGTGDTILFRDLDDGNYSLCAVVWGDLDGDGKAQTKDYVILKRVCLNTYRLEGAAYQAGLLSGESTVCSKDYIKLKRYVLGTYTR